MAKQRIDGDNNVQIGKVEGNLKLERRAPIMRKDDPNVVDCPFGCGVKTWCNAEQCWNCTRRVKDHFIAQQRKARLETKQWQALISGAVAAALLFGFDHLPESLRGYALALGLGVLGATVLLLKSVEQLERSL